MSEQQDKLFSLSLYCANSYGNDAKENLWLPLLEFSFKFKNVSKSEEFYTIQTRRILSHTCTDKHRGPLDARDLWPGVYLPDRKTFEKFSPFAFLWRRAKNLICCNC